MVIYIHIPSLLVWGLKWYISYAILENVFENQSILLCATVIWYDHYITVHCIYLVIPRVDLFISPPQRGAELIATVLLLCDQENMCIMCTCPFLYMGRFFSWYILKSWTAKFQYIWMLYFGCQLFSAESLVALTWPEKVCRIIQYLVLAKYHIHFFSKKCMCVFWQILLGWLCFSNLCMDIKKTFP